MKNMEDITIREELEKVEESSLSPFATRSVDTKGRRKDEPQCDIRTVFQRDRDRIVHSKAFRRLKDKTQVFLNPEGDHYRTRLTHTLEVSQIARTIAKALRLNEDLVEAIALGHDLGHTPFGHAGERALNTAIKKCVGEGGDMLAAVQPDAGDIWDVFSANDSLMRFRHNEQSVRVAEVLERDGEGLNLTWEVLDGMRNHQTSMMPSTLEGKIVRLSDKFAYIHHDMDDALRAKILTDADVPAEIGKVLGKTTKERLDKLIHNTIRTSIGKDDILMDDEVMQALLDMRKFMFERVYSNQTVKGEEYKAVSLVETLYEYYYDHHDEMPREYQALMEKGDPVWRVTCDYIATMTDRYAISKYEELFIPKSWKY